MTWSSPPTAVFQQSPPYTWWNTYVRDNLNETAVAKATTAGSHFAATGTNSLAERVCATDFVATSQTTTSTSPVDLATVGPTVVVTTGVQAWVTIWASITNDTSGAASIMEYEISGASTVAAGVSRCIASRNTGSQNFSGLFLETGLTAGSNTFKAKYTVTSGTGTFSNRRISVFPL